MEMGHGTASFGCHGQGLGQVAQAREGSNSS